MNDFMNVYGFCNRVKSKDTFTAVVYCMLLDEMHSRFSKKKQQKTRIKPHGLALRHSILSVPFAIVCVTVSFSQSIIYGESQCRAQTEQSDIDLFPFETINTIY